MINQRTYSAAIRQREQGVRLPITLKDTQVPNLTLKINAQSEVWRFQYKPRGTRPDGRRWPTRTLTLGSHANMTLEEARALAVAAKAEVRAGGDPAEAHRLAAAQRVAERLERRTCAELLPAFVENFRARPSKSQAGQQLDRAYVGSIERGAKYVLENLGVMGLTPEGITLKPLRRLFSNRAGTTWAIRFLAIRRFLDFCVAEELIDVNLALQLPRPATGAPRQRVLTANELRKLWHEAEALDETRRDFLRFMICVPCRISEGLSLSWDQLDEGFNEWRQAGSMTKNGQEHVFALPPQAQAILQRRKSKVGGALVFPNSRGKRFSSQSNLNRVIHEQTPSVTDWTIHDLRRTFASLLGESGASFPESVVDAVLNHKQSATRGGVLGVYQRSERRREQAAVMMAWGHLLEQIIESSDGVSNVVRLS